MFKNFDPPEIDFKAAKFVRNYLEAYVAALIGFDGKCSHFELDL